MSLFYVVVGCTVQFVIGLGLAVLCAQPIRGRTFFRVVFFVPLMITPIGIGFAFRMLADTTKGPFSPLWQWVGLGDFAWVASPWAARTIIVVADSWQWIPFIFVVMLAALENVPREQVEAGDVDGANGWQIFREITWPQIAPVAATVMLIRVIEAFKLVDLPNIMTAGGPGTATEFDDPGRLLRLALARPRPVGGDLLPAVVRHRRRVHLLLQLRRPAAQGGGGVTVPAAVGLAPRSTGLGRLLEPPRVGTMSPTGKVLVYGPLAFWTLFVLFPLYWVVITSVKLPVDVNAGPVYLPWVDFVPDLHAWRDLLVTGLSDTAKAYRNSIIVGFLSTALCMLIGSMAAYALARIEYRPRFGTVLLFVASMVGMTVAAGVWGVDWRIAAAVAVALFVLLARALGRRFTGGSAMATSCSG